MHSLFGLSLSATAVDSFLEPLSFVSSARMMRDWLYILVSRSQRMWWRRKKMYLEWKMVVH